MIDMTHLIHMFGERFQPPKSRFDYGDVEFVAKYGSVAFSPKLLAELNEVKRRLLR